MQQAMAMMVMRQRMMQAARQKAEAEAAAARAANAAGGSGRLGASQLGALADLAVGNSSSSSSSSSSSINNGNNRTYRELEALQQRVAEARISDAKRVPQPRPAPVPAQTNPSPSAAATPAQPVATNGSSDEGAVSGGAGGARKQCASCMEEWPESDYSGAQLKKKGKRVCKHCVDKQAAAVPAK
jgi:hypothetical protein